MTRTFHPTQLEATQNIAENYGFDQILFDETIEKSGFWQPKATLADIKSGNLKFLKPELKKKLFSESINQQKTEELNRSRRKLAKLTDFIFNLESLVRNNELKDLKYDYIKELFLGYLSSSDLGIADDNIDINIIGLRTEFSAIFDKIEDMKSSEQVSQQEIEKEITQLLTTLSEKIKGNPQIYSRLNEKLFDYDLIKDVIMSQTVGSEITIQDQILDNNQTDVLISDFTRRIKDIEDKERNLSELDELSQQEVRAELESNKLTLRRVIITELLRSPEFYDRLKSDLLSFVAIKEIADLFDNDDFQTIPETLTEDIKARKQEKRKLIHLVRNNQATNDDINRLQGLRNISESEQSNNFYYALHKFLETNIAARDQIENYLGALYNYAFYSTADSEEAKEASDNRDKFAILSNSHNIQNCVAGAISSLSNKIVQLSMNSNLTEVITQHFRNKLSLLASEGNESHINSLLDSLFFGSKIIDDFFGATAKQMTLPDLFSLQHDIFLCSGEILINYLNKILEPLESEIDLDLDEASFFNSLEDLLQKYIIENNIPESNKNSTQASPNNSLMENETNSGRTIETYGIDLAKLKSELYEIYQDYQENQENLRSIITEEFQIQIKESKELIIAKICDSLNSIIEKEGFDINFNNEIKDLLTSLQEISELSDDEKEEIMQKITEFCLVPKSDVNSRLDLLEIIYHKCNSVNLISEPDTKKITERKITEKNENKKRIREAIKNRLFLSFCVNHETAKNRDILDSVGKKEIDLLNIAFAMNCYSITETIMPIWLLNKMAIFIEENKLSDKNYTLILHDFIAKLDKTQTNEEKIRNYQKTVSDIFSEITSIILSEIKSSRFISQFTSLNVIGVIHRIVTNENNQNVEVISYDDFNSPLESILRLPVDNDTLIELGATRAILLSSLTNSGQRLDLASNLMNLSCLNFHPEAREIMSDIEGFRRIDVQTNNNFLARKIQDIINNQDGRLFQFKDLLDLANIYYPINIIPFVNSAMNSLNATRSHIDSFNFMGGLEERESEYQASLIHQLATEISQNSQPENTNANLLAKTILFAIAIPVRELKLEQNQQDQILEALNQILNYKQQQQQIDFNAQNLAVSEKIYLAESSLKNHNLDMLPLATNRYMDKIIEHIRHNLLSLNYISFERLKTISSFLQQNRITELFEATLKARSSNNQATILEMAASDRNIYELYQFFTTLNDIQIYDIISKSRIFHHLGSLSVQKRKEFLEKSIDTFLESSGQIARTDQRRRLYQYNMQFMNILIIIMPLFFNRKDFIDSMTILAEKIEKSEKEYFHLKSFPTIVATIIHNIVHNRSSHRHYRFFNNPNGMQYFIDGVSIIANKLNIVDSRTNYVHHKILQSIQKALSDNAFDHQGTLDAATCVSTINLYYHNIFIRSANKASYRNDRNKYNELCAQYRQFYYTYLEIYKLVLEANCPDDLFIHLTNNLVNPIASRTMRNIIYNQNSASKQQNIINQISRMLFGNNISSNQLLGLYMHAQLEPNKDNINLNLLISYLMTSSPDLTAEFFDRRNLFVKMMPSNHMLNNDVAKNVRKILEISRQNENFTQENIELLELRELRQQLNTHIVMRSSQQETPDNNQAHQKNLELFLFIAADIINSYSSHIFGDNLEQNKTASNFIAESSLSLALLHEIKELFCSNVFLAGILPNIGSSQEMTENYQYLITSVKDFISKANNRTHIFAEEMHNNDRDNMIFDEASKEKIMIAFNEMKDFYSTIQSSDQDLVSLSLISELDQEKLSEKSLKCDTISTILDSQNDSLSTDLSGLSEQEPIGEINCDINPLTLRQEIKDRAIRAIIELSQSPAIEIQVQQEAQAMAPNQNQQQAN